MTDEFEVQKANEEQVTVAKGAVLPDGTYQSLEPQDVIKEKVAEEVKQAQKKYFASLGIDADGRRIGKPEWVLQAIERGVPVWRYDWSVKESKSKYPPEKLRQLRAERGVGPSRLLKKNLTNQ